jgi:hypothetical protein
MPRRPSSKRPRRAGRRFDKIGGVLGLTKGPDDKWRDISMSEAA